MSTENHKSTRMGGCLVNIRRKFVPYAVHTKQPAIKSYHDTIFDGVVKPLCNTMQDVNGYAVDGCETAAAFTSWEIETDPFLYQIDAEKRTGIKQIPFKINAVISTALPQWNQIHKTTDGEREEVRRFEMRTAYHERGHSLACEHAIHSITRFVQCMPAVVALTDLESFNESAMLLINQFYISMSRKADSHYDAVTGHGLTQGAEARDSISVADTLSPV